MLPDAEPDMLPDAEPDVEPEFDADAEPDVEPELLADAEPLADPEPLDELGDTYVNRSIEERVEVPVGVTTVISTVVAGDGGAITTIDVELITVKLGARMDPK